jgi:DnaJ-class molecular chaperone
MDKHQCLQILDLTANASPEDIKKAYKKMALKYHPDRQEQSLSAQEKKQAEEKFKQISEAYELLMNPEKFNTMNNGAPGFGRGFVDPNELFAQIFRDMNIHQQGHGQGHAQNPFSNIFEMHINGGMPFGGMPANNVMRSSSVFFINGQKIEKVTEIINGVAHEHTFISGNNPEQFQNIRFNFQH